MQQNTREATGFTVASNGIVKVIFPDAYELWFVPQIKRRFHRRAIRNVQLWHNGLRIAQYEGLVEYSSKKDPYADNFTPRTVLGNTADLIEFWESALNFLDAKYRHNKSNPGSDVYSHKIKYSWAVASSSKRDLESLNSHQTRETQS
jgi:hypothetical protein